MVGLYTVWDWILVMLYPLGAFNFIFLSKKCFYEKLPVWKGVLMLLLSPSAAHGLSYLVCSLLITDLENNSSTMLFVILDAVFLAVFQLLFMFIYIRLVQAKNKTIAAFLYLCSTMLIPGIILAFSVDMPIPTFLSTVGLSVTFYFLTAKTLIEIAKEKQITNIRLFMSLPVIVFIYKSFSTFIGTYHIITDIQKWDTYIEVSKQLKTLENYDREMFKGLVLANILDERLFLILMYTSDLLILVILMVAFSVITRNIIYVNKAKKAHEETKTLAVEMMEALAHTIDAKDAYTKGHSVRVAKYSRMLAEKMGLSEKECDSVYYYGLLHDVGKIGVPDGIINSPNKLTEDEYDLIKKHPVIGYDILEEVHSRPDLTIGARWHHERYDGKGYPDGKSGEEIPLLARIIAVADSYDAMTSNRSYRSYMPQEKVRAEIEHNMGTQFDPEITRKMLEIIDADTAYTLHE